MAGMLAAVGTLIAGPGQVLAAGANLLGSGGNVGQLLSGGNANLGSLNGLLTGNLGAIPQILTAIYGFDQSRKLQKMMRPPNPADLPGIPGYQAGLDAVQRSMAAQGYQGSGNMMAALQKYGGDAYAQHWQNMMTSAQAQSGPLTGQMSSIGLGVGGLKRLMPGG